MARRKYLGLSFSGLSGSLMFQMFPASAGEGQILNAFLPFILVGGIIVGGLQGAVLPDHFQDRRLTIFWILAYTSGAVINLIWTSSVMQGGAELLLAVVAGLINGSLTWLILRRYLHKVQWWVAANIAASVLALMSNALAALTFVMTGFVLAWLACDPIQQQKPAVAE